MLTHAASAPGVGLPTTVSAARCDGDVRVCRHCRADDHAACILVNCDCPSPECCEVECLVAGCDRAAKECGRCVEHCNGGAGPCRNDHPRSESPQRAGDAGGRAETKPAEAPCEPKAFEPAAAAGTLEGEVAETKALIDAAGRLIADHAKRNGVTFIGREPAPSPSPREPAPSAWTFKPGRFDVRASCPRHPDEPMRRFGDLARCSYCGDAIDLCCATLGSKECVREKGHPPDLHTSPSGSSWAAAPSPREDGPEGTP